MDFSQLSNEELLALKAGDYSKLSNKSLMSLKQQSTSIRPVPEDIANEKGLQDVSITPITKPDLEQAGEQIATSKLGQAHPYLGAAAGTAVAKADDIAMAAAGLGEVAGAAKAAKGAGQMVGEAVDPLLTALKPGGRAALGKEIGAIDSAAGISERLPTVSNTAKRMNLPARERQFSDIVNKVRAKLDAGESIPVQDLADFKDLVSQQFKTGQLAKGDRVGAVTAKTSEDVTKLLNKLIPERAGPAAKYAKVKQLQNAMVTLAKGTGIVGGGLGLSNIILRKLAGH